MNLVFHTSQDSSEIDKFTCVCQQSVKIRLLQIVCRIVIQLVKATYPWFIFDMDLYILWAWLSISMPLHTYFQD